MTMSRLSDVFRDAFIAQQDVNNETRKDGGDPKK